jgi:hypothetical protein
MKLSTWTHPKTNEVRIYINGLTSLFMKKAWLVEEGGSWRIKTFDIYGSQLDSLYNEVEDVIQELNGGERTSDFNQVLKLV